MDKRGEVHISPDIDYRIPEGRLIDPARARFSASWQDDHGEIESAEFEGADAAVAWGRERSDFVLIGLGWRSDLYFSAGETHISDPEDGPLPTWPPAKPPSEGWWPPRPRTD